MNKVLEGMPAYTYGAAAVGASLFSLDELEQLKKTVGLTLDDEQHLR